MASVSRVGTSRNLEDGGTHDLLVMGFANGFPRGYVSFEIGDSPRRITGIQKVVQTFLKILLTTKGSDPVHNNYGTTFSSYIRMANIGTDTVEMEQEVREAIQDAEQQTMYTLNSSRRDLSSQLASIGILYIEAAEESLNVGLKVITLGGETASIAVPFPQTDLELNG
jgi:phage baseplate assembly protein W